MGLLLNGDGRGWVSGLDESMRLLLDGDLGASDLHTERVGFPVASQVDRAAVLALMLDLEPLIKPTIDAQRRKLDDC